MASNIEQINPEAKPDMPAENVITLYNLLENNGIQIYIDGGWGIDALLGEHTRNHGDLDIAIRHKDVSKLRELLKQEGYEEIKRQDTSDYNFVLSDKQRHEVDVHSYMFDSKGNNVYGIAYPLASLSGTGSINGTQVKCIALEYVLKFHANYEPDEDDLKDVRALCDRFGVQPPENYKGRI